MTDYFRLLAKQIVRRVENEDDLRDLVVKVRAAHTHHIAGETGLRKLLDRSDPKVSTLLSTIKEFNETWREKHPDWQIDPSAREQGGHIQSLAESLDREVSNRIRRRLGTPEIE